MKESFGALSITTIFVTLIILFSGYLCISVNQTKAYNVKNELVNIGTSVLPELYRILRNAA